jgi:hypothetical protein
MSFMEGSIGHYFLRLTAAGLLFGDSHSSIAALADAGGYPRKGCSPALCSSR